MVEDSDVAYVVEKLSKFVEPDNIMLVGARCRDIHQRTYRDQPATRTTDDIDFALAIESWDDFLAVKEAFPSRAKVWQRIDVNGLPIDLVPFGEVETRQVRCLEMITMCSTWPGSAKSSRRRKTFH